MSLFSGATTFIRWRIIILIISDSLWLQKRCCMTVSKYDILLLHTYYTYYYDICEYIVNNIGSFTRVMRITWSTVLFKFKLQTFYVGTLSAWERAGYSLSENIYIYKSNLVFNLEAQCLRTPNHVLNMTFFNKL